MSASGWLLVGFLACAGAFLFIVLFTTYTRGRHTAVVVLGFAAMGCAVAAAAVNPGA